MKKTSTKKKPPSPKRPPAKAAKRTTPSPSAKPPKGAPKAAPRPAAKVPAKKSRTVVHHEPANAPKAAPPAPTPARPAEEPSFDVREEREIPGEAMDGYRLSAAIRYAAKVTPKEDGVIVFTHLEGHLPLISGHDQRRAHTGYLSAKAAFHLHAAVPREDALSFAALLDGLSWPRVRLGADGTALVRHGTAQPAVRFDLGTKAITQKWQPPTQQGRAPAVGPLRIAAAWQAAACRWSKAVAHVYQSADGIEWVTLSDEETGELLARAVLAEDGKDLYPEDERQTEIPGSRTAGARPAAPPPAEEPAEEATAAPNGGVTIEADGREVAVDEGAGVAPTFPTPGTRPVVVAIPAEIHDALTDAQRDALRVPGSTQVFWFVGDEVVTSASMDAASATAVAGLLAAAGLCCAKADPTTRHGTEVDLWAVERAPAAAGG